MRFYVITLSNLWCTWDSTDVHFCVFVLGVKVRVMRHVQKLILMVAVIDGMYSDHC